MSTRPGMAGLLFVAVALSLASCGEVPGGSDDSDSPDPTITSTTPIATTIGAGEPTTTRVGTTSTVPAPLDEAVSRFQEWVAALAEGESERAWDLMAPSSRLAFGSYERFFDMRSGFAEGWGS